MNGLKRHVTLALIVLALVVAFMAGTMVASGSPAPAPAAITPEQWVAVQSSNWLMTTQVKNDVFLPTVVRQ
jgi:hypothetical protein